MVDTQNSNAIDASVAGLPGHFNFFEVGFSQQSLAQSLEAGGWQSKDCGQQSRIEVLGQQRVCFRRFCKIIRSIRDYCGSRLRPPQ